MKWILKFTLPTGEVYCASAINGNFALVPANGSKFKNAISWNSATEAKEWFFKKFQVTAGPEIFSKMMLLKPEVVRCQLLQ